MDSNISVCSTDTGFVSMLDSSSGDISTTHFTKLLSQSPNHGDDATSIRDHANSLRIDQHSDVRDNDNSDNGDSANKEDRQTSRKSCHTYKIYRKRKRDPNARHDDSGEYSLLLPHKTSSLSPSSLSRSLVATTTTTTSLSTEVIMPPEEEHARLVGENQTPGQEQQQQHQRLTSFSECFNAVIADNTVNSTGNTNDDQDRVVSLSSLDVPLVKREEDWLTAHGFVEYVAKRDYSYGTVLYSHETRKRYILKHTDTTTAALERAARNIGGSNSDGIDVEAFCQGFVGIGHTFCIDHEISYVRPFTLDVDCLLCHRPDTSQNLQTRHCNENSLNKLVGAVISQINTIMGAGKANVSVWQRPNTHNYHIYTNLKVSGPLQAWMVVALRALLKPESYVLDLPTFMPLPCSQKRSSGDRNGGDVVVPVGLPYVEISRPQDNASLSVYPRQEQEFYENCCLCERELVESNKNYAPILSLTQGTSSLVFALTDRVVKSKVVPVLDKNYREISCLNTQVHSRLLMDTVSAYFGKLNTIMMELCQESTNGPLLRLNYKLLELDTEFINFTRRYLRQINDFFYIVNQYLVSSDLPTRSLLYNRAYNRSVLLKHRRSDLFEVKHNDVLVNSWCLPRETTTSDNTQQQQQQAAGYRSGNDSSDDDTYSSNNYEEEYANCYMLLTSKSHTGIENMEQTSGGSSKKHGHVQDEQQSQSQDRWTLTIKPHTLEAFVRESAYEQKAWNLQHYIVALHKALLCEDDLIDFKRWLLLLYRSSETGEIQLPRSVPILLEKYALPIEKAYLCEYDDIVRYMATVYHNKLTVDMSVSDVINRLVTNVLGVNSMRVYSHTMRNKNGVLLKNQCEDFYNAIFPILQRTRLYIKFRKFMYTLDNLNWYYDRMDNALPTLSDWPTDLVERTFKAIKTMQGEFSVTYMSHPIPFLVPTDCGVFNVITGMYVSHTPLLGFVKCRRYVVYPQLCDNHHRCYVDLNEDILAFRDSHSRFFYNLVTKHLNMIYSHYMFIPAITSLRFAYKINSDSVVKLFSVALDYQLDGASIIVELYPFRRNLVAYTLMLFNMYGLETVSNYRKLCVALFNIDVENEHWENEKQSRVKESHWLCNYQQLMDNSYDKPLDAFSIPEDDNKHKFLDILRSFNNGVVHFSTHECVVGVALLAALFKTPGFATFFSAFGYPDAPKYNSMPIPTAYNTILDWDSVTTYKPSVSVFNMIAMRTRTIVLRKRPKCNMDNAFFNLALQLGFCVCFDRQKYAELLNMLTVSMITTNTLKKMIILYGGGDCGKSYLLDALTYALHPFVFAMSKNLDKHNERSGVIAKNLMIRCNELPCIDAITLKAYTGEDTNSNQVFYSQHYELNVSGQALFFAGTNYHIRFRDESSKKQPIIDPALIKRLHAIVLAGEHLESIAIFDGKSSIFTMIANSRFFIGTTDKSETRRHFALMWLLYENYQHTRDPDTFNPHLNLNIPDSICYRQMVYMLNSDLYSLLTSCDLCYEQGFTIMKKHFMRAVSCAFTNSSTTGSAAISLVSSTTSGNSALSAGGLSLSSGNQIHMTRGTFINTFNDMYNINLDMLREDDYIANFQFINLVRRVMEDFKTEYQPGEKLTEHDFERKLAKYKNREDRYQADEYFRRKQSEFVYHKEDNAFALYDHRFVNEDNDENNHGGGN